MSEVADVPTFDLFVDHVDLVDKWASGTYLRHGREIRVTFRINPEYGQQLIKDIARDQYASTKRIVPADWVISTERSPHRVVG